MIVGSECNCFIGVTNFLTLFYLFHPLIELYNYFPFYIVFNTREDLFSTSISTSNHVQYSITLSSQYMFIQHFHYLFIEQRSQRQKALIILLWRTLNTSRWCSQMKHVDQQLMKCDWLITTPLHAPRHFFKQLIIIRQISITTHHLRAIMGCEFSEAIKDNKVD